MQVYMFASFYYSSKAELNRIWVNGIKENIKEKCLLGKNHNYLMDDNKLY